MVTSPWVLDWEVRLIHGAYFAKDNPFRRWTFHMLDVQRAFVEMFKPALEGVVRGGSVVYEAFGDRSR